MGGRIGMKHSDEAAQRIMFRNAKRWRSQGYSCKWIGVRIGLSKSGVEALLTRFEGSSTKLPERKCRLPECGESFTPVRVNSFYHSRKCLKRDTERRRRGITLRNLPCRLPECDAEVTAIGKKFRFCRRAHAARYDGRARRGYYDKLINKTKCSNPTCDYWGPGLEDHHVRFKHKGGSDHKRNLKLLCSNCHTLIHSNLATFDGKIFVDLREEVRERELERRKRWSEAH